LLNPITCEFVTDTPIKIEEKKTIQFGYKDYKQSGDRYIYGDRLIIEAPDRLYLESIVVFDYVGRPISVPVTKDATDMELNVKNLASGMYTAKIKVSNGTILTVRFLNSEQFITIKKYEN
jgi:hypothetical protein